MLLQRPVPTIRPLTTAHLTQTMSLLELNAIELLQKVEAELANNPALELIDERRCPTCQRLLHGNRPCPHCLLTQTNSPEQPIIFLSYRKDFFSSTTPKSPDADDYDEDQTASSETLAEYVFKQIAPDLVEEDRAIAMHILTSLNEDGLLEIPLLEISRYHHISHQRVEQVQRLIQHADPLGVGSPTPQAALLVQLEVLQETRVIPPLAPQAVQAGFELLTPHHCAELGRALGISIAQAREVVQFISDNLNPFPGRAHWGDPGYTQSHSASPVTPYRFPDVIIARQNDDPDTSLVVEVSMPFDGTLRVNPLFRQALQQAPEDKVELWQSDLEQANLLVKCLQQRNHTIVRLMQRLSVLQRDFILYGDSHLHPLTRAEMAKELEVHESTISRAVSGKSVQLPNKKIVPLDMFFDRSLHIRAALKLIIDQEIHPLSDTQIANLLSHQGYPVARRTVAKYRSMEGILPAHLRAYNR
jgi:RNA polymerase sigma-54 factor